MQFVIPGLTKPAPYLIRGNPVPFWIPAGVYPVPRYGAGMTPFVAINVAVYNPKGGGWIRLNFDDSGFYQKLNNLRSHRPGGALQYTTLLLRPAPC
jgi:hypothetical protein